MTYESHCIAEVNYELCISPKNFIRKLNHRCRIFERSEVKLFIHRIMDDFYTDKAISMILNDCNVVVTARRRSDGRLIGILLSDGKNQLKFNSFYVAFVGVDEYYRKQGVGTEMFQLLFSKSDALRLHVATSNSSAVRFYKKLGFVDLAIEYDYYKNQNIARPQWCDALVMGWRRNIP